MRILFLSQRIPYPPNRGDKITTWRLVERMRRRHDVRVVAFAHGEEDVGHAKELDAKRIPTTAIRYDKSRALAASWPALLRREPITLHAYGSAELQAAVDREIERGVDLAYAYSSSMGAFLLPHPDLAWVMHFAELDSDKWLQYARSKRWPSSWIYAREGKLLLDFERRAAAASRENVFCTGLEQAIFRERVPGRSSCVLRNGVDLEFFKPAPERAEPAHIVFTGVMDYFPNVDACEFFAREVLPVVRREHPHTRFSIVGSHPTPRVRALGNLPGVTVTGFVHDTRDWLARASLAVAPLRIARGIQNKVLEACAMGLPLVGSTSATQGVEWKGAPEDAPFVVADGTAETAAAVSALLKDRAAAAKLGRSARAFVEANYAWERCLDELDRILARCAPAA